MSSSQGYFEAAERPEPPSTPITTTTSSNPPQTLLLHPVVPAYEETTFHLCFLPASLNFGCKVLSTIKPVHSNSRIRLRKEAGKNPHLQLSPSSSIQPTTSQSHPPTSSSTQTVLSQPCTSTPSSTPTPSLMPSPTQTPSPMAQPIPQDQLNAIITAVREMWTILEGRYKPKTRVTLCQLQRQFNTMKMMDDDGDMKKHLQRIERLKQQIEEQGEQI